MKLVFCTLFDSNYLSRGLVLYDSLIKHCPNFHLYIFAFDQKCYSILKKLNLPHITPISLEEYEDQELLKVKKERTIAEYCWTNTPSTAWYVLNHFEVDHCTYLDADMVFYANPQPLITEMGNKSVLITEHRYTNPEGLEELAGRYNVQFITFKNDTLGREVCLWWRKACLDWCYDRYEDGKFGDQKYLDDWPSRFKGIHVLEHEGGGLATWNIQQYQISKDANGTIKVVSTKTGKSFQAIFFHFHALKFFQGNIVYFTPDYLPKKALSEFYFPYVQLLLQKRKSLLSIDSSFEPNGILKPSPKRPLSFRDKLYLCRKEFFARFFKLKPLQAFEALNTLLLDFKKHHYYYYY
jgi:hypothetical protein